MTRAMVRWTAAGALALALGGVAGTAAPSARAAPSASPFAGSYTGTVPGSVNATAWSINVTSSGGVRGSWAINGGPGDAGGAFIFRGAGDLSGRIRADGTMSLSGSESTTWHDLWTGTTTSDRYRIRFNATATLDAAGNVIGTTDTGATFVWRRW